MRWIGCALLAIGLTVRAADDKPAEPTGPKDAQAVLTEAIAAAGGKEKLEALDSCILHGKGTLELQGTLCPFTVETRYQLPHKALSTIQLEVSGRKYTIKQGVTIDHKQGITNDEKAWASLEGSTQKLSQARLDEAVQEVWVESMTRLHSLLGEHFKSELIPAQKSDGKDVIGLRVSTDGSPRPVDLFFDYTGKKVGPLVKVVRKAVDLDTGKEVVQETLLSDPKDTENGVKYPSKIVIKRQGRKVVEMEIADLKAAPAVDAKEFEPPASGK